MSAFVAGIIFGGLITASVFVLFLGRSWRPTRREPVEWEEDYFDDPPPVVTKLTINKRNYTL